MPAKPSVDADFFLFLVLTTIASARPLAASFEFSFRGILSVGSTVARGSGLFLGLGHTLTLHSGPEHSAGGGKGDCLERRHYR